MTSSETKAALVRLALAAERGLVVASETSPKRPATRKLRVVLRKDLTDPMPYRVHWQDRGELPDESDAFPAAYFEGDYLRDPVEAVESYLARCLRLEVHPLGPAAPRG